MKRSVVSAFKEAECHSAADWQSAPLGAPEKVKEKHGKENRSEAEFERDGRAGGREEAFDGARD